MKKLLLIFLPLLMISFSFAQKPLFLIVQNDHIGYIDAKGEVVIKPEFINGNEFSEGLASVRKNGMYGFIDSTGNFVIPPIFEYTTDFYNGIIAVFKEGRPFFIDQKGRQLLDSHFVRLRFIDPQRIIVTTSTNKAGVFDLRTQRFIIDTLYSSISSFSNGVAVVEKYVAKRDPDNPLPLGVIDSTGRLVVAFGNYSKINPFVDGYAIVEIQGRKDDIDAAIDTKGNLMFVRPRKNHSYIGEEFHEGFAKVNLYKYWIPEKKGIISTSEKDYEGFINLHGEVVLDDSTIVTVKDFSCGRAFVSRNNSEYYMINTNLKRVSSLSFSDILYYKFENGYAIVKTEDGWGIIDTSANFIIKPQYEEIHRVGILGNYFFFTTESNNDEPLYGIADLNNKVIVKPIIKQFDPRGFVNGCIRTFVNDRLTYFDQKGNIIWQATLDTTKSLKKLNIDFMNRGYFYAYSSPSGTNADRSGGWAMSKNIPKKINKPFDRDSFSVTIDSVLDTFAVHYQGHHLYISNSTSDTMDFKAQDSRLYLKLQALNSKAEWKDIEYLPSSWCGNSYHTLRLEPGSYWQFNIPDYNGEFKTKVRAELKYIDKENPKKDKVIYSNSIDASINPAQFWNKMRYYPRGIMDPYFD
jgi:hypothetical protein